MSDSETIRLHRLEHRSGVGPYAAAGDWPVCESDSFNVRINDHVGMQAFSCHRDPRYKTMIPQEIHAGGWYRDTTPTTFEANPWAYACPDPDTLCQWFGVPEPRHQADWVYVVIEIPAEHAIISIKGEQAIYRVDVPHTRTELTLKELHAAYHAIPRETFTTHHEIGVSGYCYDCDTDRCLLDGDDRCECGPECEYGCND